MDAGPPVINYTFMNDNQMWALSDYPDTSSVNLFANYAGDAGTDALPADAALADGGAGAVKPSLAFDALEGTPPGHWRRPG